MSKNKLGKSKNSSQEQQREKIDGVREPNSRKDRELSTKTTSQDVIDKNMTQCNVKRQKELIIKQIVTKISN